MNIHHHSLKMDIHHHLYNGSRHKMGSYSIQVMNSFMACLHSSTKLDQFGSSPHQSMDVSWVPWTNPGPPLSPPVSLDKNLPGHLTFRVRIHGAFGNEFSGEKTMVYGRYNQLVHGGYFMVYKHTCYRMGPIL